MTRRIAVLIFDQFQLLDAAGPLSAFEIAGRFVPGAYRIEVIAEQAGMVASTSGAALGAAALDDAALDTLVISGGDGVRQAVRRPGLVDWVRTAAGRARRVTSVCTGAFMLAQAGLLEGRRATTHWSATAEFARYFPQVTLEPDRIFVPDGPVWTSAGITAGIDLALALIAIDLGEAIALRTAQQLVVHRRRPGGQSQHSALGDIGVHADRFASLLAWMAARLSEPLSVERLAAQAAMSPRNFSRAFVAATGLTPAKAVERLRLEAARDQVEASAQPIDRVAQATGFGDPERMRRAFIRAFGQPPQALRRAARA
ncbi:MAG: GlxA family transcriptional regulator [Phenylobacterium sp.]|uniref:GlxA family transcriptional regulator n=1 Tax=Phenylobacterium sp. TaxID=1871053 RepID=UPI002734F973|nr:GlxA family transcriptional regulator [Phenylobacterium sp.]MDP3175306.1 GlxA family transcriptional regulator [Phenylobacterium sp.]